MKITSIVVAILTVSIFAHAEADQFQQFETASPSSEATAGTQSAKAETPMFGKETTSWNFNLGMSEFDYNTYQDSGVKGKGLSFEIQKRFLDIFYAGFNYTNYTTEGMQHDSYNNVLAKTTSYMYMTTISLEAHVIRLPLPGRSEFFGAVNAGVMAPLNKKDNSDNIVGSDYFFGAGVGINISNQIGLRADIKSTPEIRAYNTVSLVGYY